jgi:SNF2 family DNA or RNA helicase
VTLDYIHLKRFSKTLLVCPKALLFVWEDEILTHRPELSFYVVKTTDWEKERAGIEAAQVVIVNYTKAVTLKGFFKRAGFEFIHVDEALIKDPGTARTKALTELSGAIPYRCLGSGTLVNNTVLDVFAPVRFLHPSLVGGSYHSFEKTYAVIQETKKDENGKSKRFVAGYRNKDEVRSILDSCCIVMSKDKWLSLPKKQFHDILVPMQGSQKSTYDDLRSNYICKIPGTDTYLEVDNPLVMMAKLFQISSGFIYTTPQPEEMGIFEGVEGRPKDGEGEEGSGSGTPPSKKLKRETYFFKENPKAQALKKLLIEKVVNKRAIVWYNMSAELTILEKVFSELGITYEVIKGGEKKTGEKVRHFNRNKQLQLLVCQAKSVNYGITVLGHKAASEDLEGVDPSCVVPELESQVYTQIFYSLNFSLEVYLQQQDRVHRIGQDHACDYYRLFTTSAVERKLRSALDDKMGIRMDMLVDIATKLRAIQDESLV